MTEIKNIGAVHIGVASQGGKGVLKKIEEDLARELNHLLHLANDLCQAYGTAVRRVTNDDLRDRLAQLDKSHDRYRIELEEYITSIGHTATHSGDLHGLLERGRVVIGQLKGDEGILRAMASNESEMAAAYREALRRPILPPEVREIVERALRHETAHRTFYDDALGRFVG